MTGLDTRLQLRVQRYGWDAAAPVYEDEWRGNLAPAHEALIRALDPAPGQQVMETAAGTGLVSFPVAQAVLPGGHITATDISGEMVQIGNDTAARNGISNVTFERQNAEDLSFEDARFDRAFSALGLMYFPNPDAALSEMRRVLRPGGRLAVAVWGERRNCGWASIFPITDARVQSEVCPMFFGLGASDALRMALEAAGFSDIEEQRLSVNMQFDSAERLLAAVIDGGAVAMAAKRFDAATRKQVDDEFLASVAAYRTGEGFAIPGEFLIATATA